MDFGGEGSARKFPSSRASPPEPRAAARIASASAARAWPRRNENLERMARARREGILHAAGEAPNPGQVNQTPALLATGSASPFGPYQTRPWRPLVGGTFTGHGSFMRLM